MVFGTTDSALSVFTRADFSVGSGAAAARLLEERMQEPWNSASRPRQLLDTTQLSQSLHDLESSDWNYRWRDTGGIKTVQVSGQAGGMLATLDGSPQAGQLLGELESDKREKL